MNNAAIQGLRNLYASNITIAATERGFEVRQGGRLQGICATLEGAKELASLLPR